VAPTAAADVSFYMFAYKELFGMFWDEILLLANWELEFWTVDGIWASFFPETPCTIGTLFDILTCLLD